MKQLLLRLMVLAGIAVNVGFLLINLSPEKPHLQRRKRVKVLLRADTPRAQWIKENQFDEFAAGHDIKFEIIAAHSFEEVLTILKAERDHPTGISLTSISDSISDELREEHALRPMQDQIEGTVLTDALGDYIPESIERSRGSDGKVWFLPKRAEVNIAVYLDPAVEEAYLHWSEDRPAMQAALLEVNGFGLPKDFQLEKTPDTWDSYDLFAAAWYWAHHPAPWAEGAKIAPRVAFRTGPNEDATSDLVGSFYRHGLSDGEIGKADAPAVLDALQWEALFRRHHLLAPECEAEKGIDSDGVNALFKLRHIAWAPINQEDSLWLHGGAMRTAAPGIPDPRALGWATLPVGESIELKGGLPARRGKSYSFREIHFWALPVHSPEPRLAFELARFVTQRGLQQRETEAQGLLPVRQDLRQDYPILFRLDWMQHILDASYHQIERGSGPLPPQVAAKGYDDLYADLQRAVLKDATVTPPTLAAVGAAMKAALVERDAAKAKDKDPRHGQ